MQAWPSWQVLSTGNLYTMLEELPGQSLEDITAAVGWHYCLHSGVLEFLFHRTHYAAINAKNSVTAKMPAEEGRPVQRVVRLATAITIAQMMPRIQTALAVTLPSARAALNGCF